MERIEGDFSPPDGRIALLASRFNEVIVARLIEGARDLLLRHGVDDDQLTLVRVPGAFELPLTADKLAASGRYVAIVALGCVIRGETTHYETVCNESNRGLMDVALGAAVPVGNAILTVENEAQAHARSRGGIDSKGADAARACLSLIAHGRAFDGAGE